VESKEGAVEAGEGAAKHDEVFQVRNVVKEEVVGVEGEVVEEEALFQLVVKLLLLRLQFNQFSKRPQNKKSRNLLSMMKGT